MFYTHGSVDRSDHLRRDDAALKSLQHAPTSRVIPVWRGTMLVSPSSGHDIDLASLSGDVALPPADRIFLGMRDEIAWFASSVSGLDDAARLALAQHATDLDGTPVAADFADLRALVPTYQSRA